MYVTAKRIREGIQVAPASTIDRVVLGQQALVRTRRQRESARPKFASAMDWRDDELDSLTTEAIHFSPRRCPRIYTTTSMIVLPLPWL